MEEAQWLTPEEFAAKHKLGIATVYRRLTADEIPHVKVGPRLYRIPANALEQMMKAQTKEG